MSLEACFDAEAMHHSRSGETADHKEAAKAFVEKRKPVFQGHEMAAICGCGRSAWWRRIEPVIGDIADIMGLKVCYRDGNVAKYGLENALLPVDTILLEVVAPFQPGTAAGRFIEKTGGRGGYMAIFCCDDPDERGARAKRWACAPRT